MYFRLGDAGDQKAIDDPGDIVTVGAPASSSAQASQGAGTAINF
jgi:hypothetical protein